MVQELKEFFKKEIEKEFSMSAYNYDLEDLYNDLNNSVVSIRTDAQAHGCSLSHQDISININDGGYDGDHDFTMQLTATVMIKNENYKREMIEYYDAKKKEFEEAEVEKKRNNINRIADEARREYKKSSNEGRLAQRVQNILSASISDEGKLEELKKLVENNK